MSPVSPRKVKDPGARVQVPFTLSDTRTCSGASYWENHPTSRSPWATGRVSVTVTVETRDPVDNAAPWTQVGVVEPATAVRGSRTPRVANTARPAVDRSDREDFIVISILCHTCSAPPWDAEGRDEERSYAARVHVSDRRPGPLSRPSWAAPPASRSRTRSPLGQSTAW